ncbi:MAG: aspartate kinase [Paludibacteraceae bacterium]|nr:aspartate kinase [Paludibacteraceae bacterium]
MKIYKFGGASVRDASGVRNLLKIVASESDNLVVVVSAMGKTTNALERVVNAIWQGDAPAADAEWQTIVAFHRSLADELSISWDCVSDILSLYDSLPLFDTAHSFDYDLLYDQVVSLGELMSTRLISTFLYRSGVVNTWLDMPHLLRTDALFREARVDMNTSARLIGEAVSRAERVCIAQGFIGGTADGLRTTLGREGSDYTAAILGNLLEATSVTIWKDVPGILNADPRLMEQTSKIDCLSYIEAVELAYSGAQIIHPKTIRPLENKHIPLYVKPFAEHNAPGSVICATDKKVDVPVYIWRKNQILITLRAKDFSFVLEESLSHIFDIIHAHRLKVSLIQSSAITISVCVDNTRYVADAIRALQQDYILTYNEGLSLLTIRGTTPEILEHESRGRTILLRQLTRRTARFVVKE